MLEEPKYPSVRDRNKTVYENEQNVLFWAGLSELQEPERIILEKYRELICGKRVLDIGCGGGRTTKSLLDLTDHYTGIDYANPMIEACRKKYENVQFCHCDVRNMSIFEDNSFDFVLFSGNGISSIDHEGRLQGLKEVHRVLKKSGIFVFSAHNHDFLTSQWNGRVPFPKMVITVNPLKQVAIIKNFIISCCNYIKHKKYQYFDKTHSVVIGMAHNCSVMTYYIDKLQQISQLKEIGFETIEMYDKRGNVLDPGSDYNKGAWIYYVAKESVK